MNDVQGIQRNVEFSVEVFALFEWHLRGGYKATVFKNNSESAGCYWQDLSLFNS